jgi:DNA-binding response OmpR family regulator
MLRSAFLAGCDDYLREPWTAAELAVRALAVLGRARERSAFPWGTLEIRGETLLTPAGPVRLGAIQCRLLKKLLASRGEPVPREALALCAWGRPARGASRALDVQVAAIREKLAAALPEAGPRFIVAVRGRGYMVS